MLTWAITGLRPCSANSFWQKARAKKPRSSSRGSRSRMKAPFSFVSVKITILPSPPRRQEVVQQARSRRHRLGKPAQVGSEVSHLHQLLELVDAPEARPLEILELEPHRLVRFVELPGALAGVPLGLERGQLAADLGEIGAVVAFVRSGVLREGDLAARHRLLHDLGDLADPEVLVVAPDVEGLSVHRLAGRGEDGEERAADVLDVDDGSPGRAIALEEDLARGEGPGAQGIVGERGEMDDGIEPAQIGDLELAHILGEGPDRLAPGAEGGAAVEVGVDPDHLVTGVEEEGGHHRPDVAAASREKDFHRLWKIRSLRQIRIRTGTRALAAASTMRRVDYATGYPPLFRSRTTG